MKQRPILFSTPMVQAILEGRKTQTRRIVDDKTLANLIGDDDTSECRYGQAGDVLWVRETFYAYGHWIKTTDKDTEEVTWSFNDLTIETGHNYKYCDAAPEKIRTDRNRFLHGWYKRPSIFMPYASARNWLRIQNVRVERLQDITDEDAIAEGIQRFPKSPIYGWRNYMYPDQFCLTPRESFFTLWESINGKESLEANHWVWVVEFTRIKKPHA